MLQIKLEQVIKASGGKYFGDPSLLSCYISDVSIDSRKILKGSLFIPIKGERFDGHNFIDKAFENGAICCISERPLLSGQPNILVESSLNAFQSIAEYYRMLFKIPVIGLTGSVGKTTTKELIASVLSKQFNVLKNEGNLNNQTGVPITILRLNKEHEAAVIEMGTNHFGEILKLSKIARPNICVITNIGEAHIENFGSRTGTLAAKCEILEHMAENGKVVVNGDDPLLCTLTDKIKHIITFGLGGYNDVCALHYEEKGLLGSSFVVDVNSVKHKIDIPAPGKHMVLNALAAISVGLILDMSMDLIKQGIADYCPTSGRMDIIKLKTLTILNDVYNANPTSMSASVDILSGVVGRKVCILGDMFELGKDELEYHKKIGVHAAKKGIDLIICVGELSKAMYESAKKEYGNALYFGSQDELISALPSLIKKGDTVLIKASRGMHLEKSVQALVKYFENL